MAPSSFALSCRPVSGTAAIVLCAFIGMATSGCDTQQRAQPVNVDLAQTTLTQVLDHWKAGGTMDALRNRDPEIIVQEELWYSGKILQEYQLTSTAIAQDANWFCDVELTLVDTQGGAPRKKTVTYAVGTDPVLTVFRAMN